ncbi:GNAT family N-acetyltransferase [Vibrio sp.]|nr:GNAT family N-acetyltransferase [Vibrio sp.]
MFTKQIDETLKLFLLTPIKADLVYNLIDENRAYLTRWMTWPPKVTSSDDTRNFIKDTLVGLSEMKEMACGIEYEGHLVGVVTFNEINFDLKKVTIGYWISDQYQGKGIITKSCQALIDYAFDSLEMQKVEIRVATENYPSQKVCERLGFTLEGTIRNAEHLHGHIVDHQLYGLFK